jgi:lipopolysaccharide transport system permease protein
MPLFVGLAWSAIAACIILGPSGWLLLLPLAIASQLLFAAGVAWILALLTIVVKDVQHILQYIVICLLIVTPIAYTEGMVPPQMQAILYLNPLYYFVRMYQHAIVYGSAPPLHVMLGAPALGLGFYLIGAHLFDRAKQVVYDYA